MRDTLLRPRRAFLEDHPANKTYPGLRLKFHLKGLDVKIYLGPRKNVQNLLKFSNLMDFPLRRGQLTWSNNHKFTTLHLYIGLWTCSSVAPIQGEHLLDVLKSMLQNIMLDHVYLLLDCGGLHSGKVPISKENLAGGFQDIMMGRWDGYRIQGQLEKHIYKHMKDMAY
ncbi:hypothetical protein LOK49_LG12G01885 [Camellia lanceoleosa]|uniref:Uncharacterized protein n=1 Tax=Camellia lanceoleosa TaxID=1840588 RepID=A0ACC0FQ88_9ERIC|nr:hypothetical protein LOK49_LG12G01885 [Camellia lanceoleosa]